MKNVFRLLTVLILVAVMLLAICACDGNSGDTSAHAHNYVAKIVKPTCQQQGYTLFFCECGDEYQDGFVDTVDHEWSDFTDECIYCGVSNSTHIHRWVNATCTEPAHCRTCDATAGSPSGHTMVSVNGCEGTSKCSKCTYTSEESIGHILDKWNIGDDGEIYRPCRNCDYIETSACDHRFAIDDSGWYAKYVCFRCSASIDQTEVLRFVITDDESTGEYAVTIESKIKSIDCFINAGRLSNYETVVESNTYPYSYVDDSLITEVIIGEGIYTFTDLGLFSTATLKLTIGNSVEVIKTNSLRTMSKIRSIYFEGDLPKLEKDALWIGNVAMDDWPYDGITATVYYHRGANGFAKYGRKIQGFKLVCIEDEAPVMPDMSMSEFAVKTSYKSMEIALEMFKKSEVSEYGFLDLMPTCSIEKYQDIKDFAIELTKDADTDYEKAQIIFNWIVQNIEYDDKYLVAPVDVVFEDRRAVCAGYVLLMKDMLSAVGINSYYIHGISFFGSTATVEQVVVYGEHSTDAENHAWIVCYLDGEAVICDPTWGDFDITPEELSMTGRAATSIEGITLNPDEIDPWLYEEICYYDDGEVYVMYSGELAALGGKGINYNLVYSVDMMFHCPNDGMIFKGSFESWTAFNNILMYHYSDYYQNYFIVSSSYHKYLYLDVLKFIAFEKLFYNNEIHIPGIDDFIIADNGVVYYLLEDGNVGIATYVGEEDHVVVPEKVDNKTVVKIQYSAFRGSYISSIDLPDTIIEIEHWAFFECYNLISIDLPKNLKYIRPGAFADCYQLKEVHMYSSVSFVGFPNTTTMCSPDLIFERLDPSKLKVYYHGTEDQFNSIHFNDPWANDGNGGVDTHQRDEFMKYLVIVD